MKIEETEVQAVLNGSQKAPVSEEKGKKETVLQGAARGESTHAGQNPSETPDGDDGKKTAANESAPIKKIDWGAIRNAIEAKYQSNYTHHLQLKEKKLESCLDFLHDKTKNVCGVAATVYKQEKLQYTYAIEQTKDTDIEISCTTGLTDKEEIHKQAELLLIAFMEQGKQTGCIHLTITTEDAMLAATLERYAKVIRDTPPHLIASVVNKNKASGATDPDQLPEINQINDFLKDYLKPVPASEPEPEQTPAAAENGRWRLPDLSAWIPPNPFSGWFRRP